MASFVFRRFYIDYTALHDSYTNMTKEEIARIPLVYDAIIRSILPYWLSWRGDDLLAECGNPDIDEAYDINEFLNGAYVIYRSGTLQELAERYGVR